MRMLAIETATEACSVALFEDGDVIGSFHETIGRGHAERLVPMIGGLADKGRAQEILVSLGPGSFTGVRIGLAAARALGLAWGATVRGYPTLALVAAIARQGGARPVGVCMNGGHGEWFVQSFGADGAPMSETGSFVPDEAVAVVHGDLVAGSRAEDLVAMRGGGTALPLRPDARFALQLPSRCLSPEIRPVYGRPPDAKPMARPAA